MTLTNKALDSLCDRCLALYDKRDALDDDGLDYLCDRCFDKIANLIVDSLGTGDFPLEKMYRPCHNRREDATRVSRKENT
jgi:hypothetical protein